ncbi:GNAT family N-acetyltransferase [Staphylospora marina]|uniref:GNAT family N-acetyltransferase n=1 Tax=Staphylospora marina TaxID=2490858 RepID=UPI0013DD8DA1|nr:GNAT family N-acetyltransferase [Staphylospora marina]
MERLVIVRGFLQSRGKVLMIKRSPDDSHAPGHYELPGGKVTVGEDPRKALEREFLEEVNLRVEVGPPLETFSETSGDGRLHILEIVYMCRFVDDSADVRLSPEHSAFRWVEEKDLSDLEVTKITRKSVHVGWERNTDTTGKGRDMMNGAKILIRKPEPADLEAFLDLEIRNREHLKPYEPNRPDRYYTRDGQRERLERLIRNFEEGNTYGFGIFLRDSGALVGRISLSNVVRGAWENCTIGYYIDHSMQGKGYATEAVKEAVRFAFAEAGLHRVQAAVMPWNLASIRVLEKAGFRFEGMAKRYLRINGKWEDHNIYAITREEWE